MQKDSNPRYLTILRTSNQFDDGLTNFSNATLESNNAGLYGFIGKVPKYSKPFSQAYLQKIQSDYQNWINSCQADEYHEMMKEVEIKEKPHKFNKDFTNQKINSDAPSQHYNQQSTNKFDPCLARHIISKTLKIKDANSHDILLDSNDPTVDNINTYSSEAAPKIHHHKQFHVGCVERTNDGTIKTFDQNVKNRREAQEVKLSKKILRYDELDLENKKKKARLLHSEMTNFLNNKRNEKLQLGLACHQEWAILKASAPSKRIQEEMQRPITASSKEAMEELEQFEQKQKQIRKEQKEAKKNNNARFQSFIQNNENKTNNCDNNNDIMNPNYTSLTADQSFKLTQLPPGSAIVG